MDFGSLICPHEYYKGLPKSNSKWPPKMLIEKNPT
jgi:hypothetical protein